MLQKKLDDSERKTKEFEVEIRSMKREKELMMATYCRLIKENERLHTKVQSIGKNFVVDDKLLIILEAKIKECFMQLTEFKETFRKYEQSIMQIETKQKNTVRHKLIIRQRPIMIHIYRF